MDEPVLPEIAAPPVDLIQVHGARLVRVLNVVDPDPRRRRGFREAVILAHAPIPGGGWAVLAAWIGAWQERSRTTGGPRWAWVRLLEDRVAPHTPDRPLVEAEGHEWHGYHELSDMAEAVRLAAASLPEHLRDAALTPRPAPGAEP